MLGPNDDGSTSEVTLPFTLDYFGTDYSSLWVNNNGNVTFDDPMSIYTPFEITSSTPPIIAPFFADVDTRAPGSGLVTYGSTTFEGHQAFCVDWPDVGYFAEHVDKLNTFQLLLVQRNDVGPGDFDIVFNYGSITWETGDASDGEEGFGGISAGVGFSNGDGDPDHFFQLRGSLENGAFLDSNPTTGLVNSDYGSTIPGRYVFHVTGTGGGGGGGGAYSRPWPANGYGYSFENRALTDFLIPAGLAPSQVFTAAGLAHTFTDWSRDAAAGGGESKSVANLMRATSGGVCFGLALSAGRLDGLLEPLSDPAAGRTDGAWSAAGSGPSATTLLAAPGAPGTSAAYNEQFLGLIADDFVTQYSTEINTSLQQQHYAYADPNKGVTALREQLESVLGSGIDRYDPAGATSSGIGTGFAGITLQTLHPSVGHEVLAYSMEMLSDGDLEIDVWDNNFPGVPHAIIVQPNGIWTYDAFYANGDFQSMYSLSGAPGYSLGLLAVLPTYDPSGLHYYPRANGGLGSGTLVDVPPGDSATVAADSGEQPVDVEPVASSGTVQNAGEVLDFPSSAGRTTVEGPEPAVDIRGEETYMTASGGAGASRLEVAEEDKSGSVETPGTIGELSVARGARVLTSNGAGGLAVAADGSVATSDDSSNVTLELTFVEGATTRTVPLYEGATVPGEGIHISGGQVGAREAAVTTTLAGGPMTGAGSGGALDYASHQSGDVASIKSALRRALVPSGVRGRIAAIRRSGGYRVSFRTPLAGKLKIDWYTRQRHGRGYRQVLLASGHTQFAAPGIHMLVLRVTPVGRRLIRSRYAIEIIGSGTFFGSGGLVVHATRSFKLGST